MLILVLLEIPRPYQNLSTPFYLQLKPYEPYNHSIVKSGKSGGLVAVETKFGWILSGCVGVGGKTQSVSFVSSATSEIRISGKNDELESQVKRFWELESLGINKYEQSFYERGISKYFLSHEYNFSSITIQRQSSTDS